MKRFISAILCLLITVSGADVFAYSYPSGFWSANTKYANALSAKDYNGIIQYGTQVINVMKNAVDGYEKRDVTATRYVEVANAYAALGEYDNAASIYKTLHEYAKQYIGLYSTDGEDRFYEYTKSSKEKALQYESVISVYTDGGQSPYYGAANEKKNGVLFGLCGSGGTRSKLDNESMLLTYQGLGQTMVYYNPQYLSEADKEGFAVEFALNCPNEGVDIKNITQMNSYLKEISDLFKKYPNVPVYLRFAAEFDVWSVNPTEPEEFKSAFRYVSQYFKSRNSNVAMVWSPNSVSGWYTDIDDYYPGDEYVDWVGVSLYSNKYFLGDPNQDENNQIFFKSGINSDPVLTMKEIVEKYGDRKPIMLAESGCGHRLMNLGEDATDFALQRLREQYSYLPMVYPQIKLMAYFDTYVSSLSEANDYRLSSNSALQSEYLKLTKGQRFIQDSFDNDTDFCYRKIADGTNVSGVFEASCYAHSYNSTISNVTYYIDDTYAGASSEIPYTVMINASGYSGTHKLTAVATFGNGKTLTSSSNIVIDNTASSNSSSAYDSTDDNITVKIDNKKIRFDQEPIAYNNRTMVPMRKIFEELGADVTWYQKIETAVAKKGDRTVKITLGERVMYVNNKEIKLDTAPFALSGRTLVPVRAVAEGMGCDVDWDGDERVVLITPKTFEWSDWSESLPRDIDDDMYYIEEKTEYRYRTREKEYFTLDYKINSSNFVDSETSYGSWSGWSENRISPSDTVEVETRTQSSPKRYFYGHYCTGNEADVSIRYITEDYKFCDACLYHTLGWYDTPLAAAEDGKGYIKYKDDGKKYRCSNTCYRWYVLDTTGGEYTEYRYRDIYKKYTYWQWDDWSRWTSWSDDDPYDYYGWNDNSIDVDERTVYRYKEKG